MEAQYDNQGDSSDNYGISGMKMACCDIFGETVTIKALYTGHGNWEGMHLCHKGSYISNLQLRYEGNRGFWKDDTTLNGVKMECERPDHMKAPLAVTVTPNYDLSDICPKCMCDPVEIVIRDASGHLTIIDHTWPLPTGIPEWVMIENGFHGGWSETGGCDAGNLVSSLKLRYEPSGGALKDDTGLNGISALCDNKKELKFTGNGGGWQANYANCPKNSFLCGIEAQFESGGADNTALNGLRMDCCDYRGKTVHNQKLWNGEGEWRGLHKCNP
eukprot:236139_1